MGRRRLRYKERVKRGDSHWCRLLLVKVKSFIGRLRRLQALKDHSGLSLVEVMVSIGIIGVAVVATLQFTNISRDGLSEEQGSMCRAYAEAAMNTYMSQALVRNVADFVPGMDGFGGDSNRDRQVGPSEAPFSFNQININNNDLWSEGQVLGDGPAPEVRNGALIQGVIRALLAIYNRPGQDICATPQNDPSLLDPQTFFDTSRVKNIQTSLQICPYELSSGTASASSTPKPLLIFPMYNTAETYAFDPLAPPASKFATLPSEYSNNHGLKVTIHAAFEKNERKYECQYTANLQYHRDQAVPPPPNFVQVVSNTGHEPMVCSPDLNVNEVTIDIGFQGVDKEKGSVIVCQDRSTIRNYEWMEPCVGGVEQPGNVASTTRIGADVWMPCDQVTACGQPPVSASWKASNSPVINGPHYELRYQNLSSDCDIRIAAATIDTAGNVSTPPQEINTTLAPDLTQMNRPRCRYYCAESEWNGYYTNLFDNGYWRCDQDCCRGSINCSPPAGL